MFGMSSFQIENFIGIPNKMQVKLIECSRKETGSII